MTDKDGWQKNLSEVNEGLDAMMAEWSEALEKCGDAINDRDWLGFVHHLTDFRGACMQHAWKLHFYLFFPKWIGVYFLAQWWFA